MNPTEGPEVTETTRAVTSGRPAARGIFIAALFAAIVAGIANSVIRIAALGAGAEPTVSGMMEVAILSLTVVGVLAGAIGWWLFVRFARNPRVVLFILVPVVFLLSLVPLIGNGVSVGTHATWTAMISLAIMHLITVLVAVPIYRRFIWLSQVDEV